MGLFITILIVIVIIAIASSGSKKKPRKEQLPKESVETVIKVMEDSIVKEMNAKKRKLEKKLAQIEGREIEEDEEDKNKIKIEEAIIEETPSEDGIPNNKFGCRIAGLQHHWVNIIPDGFIGYAEPEPLNPEDNEAIAIYDIDGDIVGYVPQKAKEEYELEFPDKPTCLVVGWIREDDEEERKYSSYVIFIRIHSWQYAAEEFEKAITMYQQKGWEFTTSDIKRVGELLLSNMEEQIKETEENTDNL